MARRRTRRRKTAKTQLVLDRHRISMIFLALGGFYFFAMQFAPDSPLMQFFSGYASYLVGQFGVNIFFALCVIVGLIVWLWGERMRTVIKAFLVSVVLISSVLNFPLLESGSMQYQQFGGYLSWPVLYILDQLFGGSVGATKAMIVIMTLIFIAWMWYVFRIPLPSLKVSVPKDVVPKRVKRESKVSAKRAKQTLSTSTLTQDKKKGGSLMGTLFGKDEERSAEKSLMKKVVKSRVEKKMQKVEEKKTLQKISFPSDKPTFDVSLLDLSDGEVVSDPSYLVQKAKNLQQKLLEFNVPISIEGFDIGPSIVQIRIRPEAGIKVSAIENLKNDVALSLKAKSLRIVSPIPGTDCIGIQLPNPQPQMVHLGDVLQSNEFRKSMTNNLTNMALGKRIDGSIAIESLEKMPHLLVAGATGAGKSVGVNDFILSLMYQNSPSELKFLMVDPKQVEMELYSGLPYLLAPIITQPDKALRLLKWAVEEMEVRYKLLKNNRVKNLVEYNNKKDPADALYRIVIVIDELADLMMSGDKKDVETCITRIAQKARAVGIHLIVATQRPSVNVITGLIKANMPTRVSFAVVSQIDSRTILGQKGAEDLVGRGDLLYMDTKTKFPTRIQAPFVDTPEIERVVTALRDKYMQGLTEEDIYHPELMSVLDGKKTLSLDTGGSGGAGSDDELVEQAIEVIRAKGKASATMLQRTLNVGFARAARILDILEKKGVVGPQIGSKAREVLI